MRRHVKISPFQGLAFVRPSTQGCTLGYLIAPFQGGRNPRFGHPRNPQRGEAAPQLATGNWQPATGNWQLATRNLRTDNPRLGAIGQKKTVQANGYLLRMAGHFRHGRFFVCTRASPPPHPSPSRTRPARGGSVPQASPPLPASGTAGPTLGRRPAGAGAAPVDRRRIADGHDGSGQNPLGRPGGDLRPGGSFRTAPRLGRRCFVQWQRSHGGEDRGLVPLDR